MSGVLSVRFKLKNLIIKAPKRGNHNQFTRFQHKPGKDGDPGDKGQPGKDGDHGDHGVSVVDAVQIDDKFFKLKFSNNTFSQQIELPQGKPGKDSDPQKPAKPGKDGEAAPTIVDIKAFSRQVIFVFSDGTEMAVPIKFPSGTGKNPGLSFGGMEPPVKDVVGISPISVADSGGIFSVSIDNTAITGLMPYRIDSGDDLTIPSGSSVISCGPFELQGGIELLGRMCV